MTNAALVTGSEGFVGRVLCQYLKDLGATVRGSDLHVPEGAQDRFACDVSDPAQVAALVDWAAPIDWVFHLAAVSFVPDAVAAPARVMAVNLGGTIHLLQALQNRRPEARFLFVGTGDAYGRPQVLPMTEEHPLAPVNPYAISKAAADQFCAFLHSSQGAPIIRARAFNHSGAGQNDQFVLSAFARQVARIEAGLDVPVIQVGNLSARRDFSHVDDVVRAYVELVKGGVPGEAYNVCSGQACLVEDALNRLVEMAGIHPEIRPDPRRMRPVDVPEVRGSYQKLRDRTGWEPVRSFDQILEDLLNDWREQVAAS